MKDVEGCEGNSRIQQLLNEALGRYEPTGLQLIVKKELVRNRIIDGLAVAFSGDYDVDALAKRLIKPDDGIFVETYEGYDLVSMRADKALAAIRPIERLREIAALTRFESVIDSIVSSCLQIGGQAQNYIYQVIDPELNRMGSERDNLRIQLSAANVEVEKAKFNEIPIWLARQLREIEAQIQTLDCAIAELVLQKRKLTDYIRTVSSLRPTS